MPRRGKDPKPGDLIEIKRRLYQHWTLYLGDGYVIHVTAVDEDAPALSASTVTLCTKKAMVRKQLLEEVVGDGDWYVNNKYDSCHAPFPVEEIIRRAESWINKEWTYGLVKKNCEHFVTMLRYGDGVSDQAKKGVATATGGLGGLLGAVVVGLGIFAAVVMAKDSSGNTSSRQNTNYRMPRNAQNNARSSWTHSSLSTF